MKINTYKETISLSIKNFFNRPLKKNEKVFAVGFNKTGTSSLHTLFEMLGLRSYHGIKWRSCEDIELLNSYDCFSDGIPHDLSKIDSLFPGSKFILQVRELDNWIYSRLAHIERNKKLETFKGALEWDNTEFAIKAWIKKRNDHHLNVLNYFSQRPQDLLVINFVRDKNAATKICKYLEYKGKVQNPKKNINPEKVRPVKHTDLIKASITDLKVPENELKFDIFCPSLNTKNENSKYPSDTSML